MNALKPYRIFPLGDAALTLDFGNFIDEDTNALVVALFDSLVASPLPGIRDLVPAYSSLTVIFDVFQFSHEKVNVNAMRQSIASQLEERLSIINPSSGQPRPTFEIPVCYDKEFGWDLDEISHAKGLSAEEIIQLHSSSTYHIYMLGFLPGFAYMGKLDSRLEMPRKAQPRQRVEPGSVGITGLQTAIYPLTSPGGWQIIGRTPVRLFRPEEKDNAVCFLHPGDEIKFIPISRDEFESY